MQRHLRVTVEGHAYDVTVEDLTDTGNQLYPDHRSMVPTNATAPVTAPTATPTAPAGGGAAASGGSAPARRGSPGSTAVLAPMSGIVHDIGVAVGEAVEGGQIVATMEAMKLKSPIVVDKPGTIASIDVAVGDAVESGATILTLH